ncbi:MAG TPA: fumarylacetoacetate hydrolase family protein [Vicinamibacterales bacterium]|nr:fumarylacetoacetate hydrolase family protein [Vicinamibacterales bacterium]
MKRLMVAAVLALVWAGTLLTAQTQVSFKLGTFQRQGRTFVGIVLRDLVVDLAAADAAVPGDGKVAPPSDMKDLIARYDAGVRDRIAAIVKVASSATARPAYVYELSALKTMPPIMYPMTMLNAAVNYREHGVEMAGRLGEPVAGAGPPPGTAPPGTTSAPGIWDRKAGDMRWNPYAFLKSPSAIVAEGEAIRIPKGRTQIDWECELGVVIGRTASYVSAAQATGYIFGYTNQMDVSDRQGRGDTRYGSDWLIGKSHDTFAPMGPFITPKEFVPNPQKLPVRFTLNGKVMQDADTSLMIHDVFELVAYGSSILTLRPGDVIATGTPAGVGSARKPPIYLKAGDRTVCTYEGVGTLSNPVEAAR